MVADDDSTGFAGAIAGAGVAAGVDDAMDMVARGGWGYAHDSFRDRPHCVGMVQGVASDLHTAPPERHGTELPGRQSEQATYHPGKRRVAPGAHLSRLALCCHGTEDQTEVGLFRLLLLHPQSVAPLFPDLVSPDLLEHPHQWSFRRWHPVHSSRQPHCSFRVCYGHYSQCCWSCRCCCCCFCCCCSRYRRQ